MRAIPSDQKRARPTETSLRAQVSELRERSRHQLEAMRETIAEVDDLRMRIEGGGYGAQV